MDNKVLENYITEMSIALEDEIKALKEGEGGKKVNLIEGQFIYKIGEKYIYKFIIDTELVYIEDTPAQMIIPGGKGKEDKYQVVINNIDANEISLALNENLGNYISEAILIIAPYYLLEILRDKLQEIKDNKIEINDKLLNNLFIEHTSSIINIIEDLEQGDLNRQQYEALKYSMERDITFIWGPPGTGKTYTIGHIIYNFIKQGKKVLIASHTNSAIDTALIKVADVIEDENLLEGGKIIRIGTPHKENSKLKKMLLDNIINDKAQILGLEKDKLEDESKSIEIILNKLNETVNFFNNLEEKLVNYQEVGEKIKNNEELFNHYIALIKETEIQLKNERENLISIEKANVIVRLFRRSAEEIKRDINRYEQKIENTGKLLKNIERDLAKDNIRKNELENEIQFLKNRIKENVGDRSKNEIIQEVNILIDKYERLNEKISEVNKKIEKIRCEIIEESLVIGTTLTKTFLEEDIYKNKYDAVIIDESSMAPLPNIFFTSGLAKNHLILSGDFRQLAPIAVAETDMVNKWLKQDIYSFAKIIKDEYKEISSDDRIVMLKEQYRVPEKITNIINDFYFGELVTKKNEVQKGSELVPIESPFNNTLIYCDVSSINPWCARPRNSYTRYNIYTAVLAVNIAKDALDKGIKEIGIITPYYGQTQLINKILMDKDLHGQVKVATVHRYQGDEKELIILDTVDGPPFKIGQLIRGGSNSNAMRLINVAVTRTKGKLVIINNYKFFKQNLSKADVVLNVLDKSFNSSYFILPQNYLKSFKEIDLSLFNKRLDISLGQEDIKNEISFYPIFKKELYEAEERVIMISPFITPNRISTLIDYFRHLVDQGIEVIIFTRPTNRQPIEKQEAEKLIKMMKDMNIKIILERDIHQKIIFIDKKICWFGSLNVLSQNRSEELMVRFKGSNTIEKLYEYSRINLYLDREKRNKEKEKYQKLIFNELIKSIQSPYCFRCEKEMTIRFGRYGPFFGCSNFPECEATENIPTEIVRNIIDEMGIPCPDDSCDGYLQYRRAKGVHFLGCSNYPVCKNTVSIF